ncbi:MAG: hypothetical protein ACOYD4_16515 [Solirubrobacterales bacterium]
MGAVLDKAREGVEQSLLMAYEVWWALVIGFAISAIVQACATAIFLALLWVSRGRAAMAHCEHHGTHQTS